MATTISDLTLYMLFGSNGPAVTPYGSVQRWLDEGNIISFTSCQMHLDNAEFQINDSKNWAIWFSQLNTPLYKGEFDSDFNGLQVCSFLFKNGRYLYPVRSNPTEFWNAVRGKRFKVNSVIPCYGPNKENPEVRILSIGQVYEKVHNSILGGRGNYIKNMLKPQKCYDFIEI